MNFEKLRYKDLIWSNEDVRRHMAYGNNFQLKKWFEEDRKTETAKAIRSIIKNKLSHEEVLNIVSKRWNIKVADDWNKNFRDKELNSENIINWYNKNVLYTVEIMEDNSKQNLDWWRFIITTISKYKNNKLNILDYGCGTGDIAVLVRSYYSGGKIVLADISNVMMKFTKFRLDERKVDDYEIIDLKKSKISNQKFDVIFCTDVLEHVVNPIEILENLNKFAKLDTFFYIMTTFSDFERTPYHLRQNEGKGREVGKYLRSNGWVLGQGWFPPTFGKLYIKKEL